MRYRPMFQPLLPICFAVATLLPTISSAQRATGAESDHGTADTFRGGFVFQLRNSPGGSELNDGELDLRIWTDGTRTLYTTTTMKGGERVELVDRAKGAHYHLIGTTKAYRTAWESRNVEEGGVGNTPDLVPVSESKDFEGTLCTKLLVKDDTGLLTGWVASSVAGSLADLLLEIKLEQVLGLEHLLRAPSLLMAYEFVDNSTGRKQYGRIKELSVGEVKEGKLDLDGYTIEDGDAPGQ